MEKKLRLNIDGYFIDVVIKSASYFHKTSHYSYGQIYVSCPLNTKEKDIVNYIKRCYPKKVLDKFPSDYLYSENYCYVLGEKRGLIRPNSLNPITSNSIVIKNDEELKKKLIKLAKDVITSRVRMYEKIMNTKTHEVKVNSMYAARGKNYYSKGLLTFSYELVHFSLELIDAIVIHELAHDFKQNHSASFYEIVYKYCPNYDIKIKKLSFGVKK